ncbi:MAG TPA: DUF6174 domain-containing protein [Pirellulaceae bacterium]|nr:DUF6174 domain-containing protein [Pirellulaceae bacterium]
MPTITPDNNVSPAGNAKRSLRWIKGAFFGALLALMAAGALSIVIMRLSSLPALTRERFDAARQQWEERAVSDYTIEVRVNGPQAATYLVEVKNHEAISALRNGAPLRQPRTWGTWSVPGIFDTVASDLESLETRRLDLVVRCLFDAELGYPTRYQRLDRNLSTETTWEVVKFSPHN